jgi:hypothetical protein
LFVQAVNAIFPILFPKRRVESGQREGDPKAAEGVQSGVRYVILRQAWLLKTY